MKRLDKRRLDEHICLQHKRLRLRIQSVCICLILLIPGTAWGQDPLEECFQIAISRSQPAQIAQKQIRFAQLKVREVWRELFPKLLGEYTTTEGETITEPYEALSYGIQLEQQIFDSGKRKDTLRRERLGLEIAKKSYLRVENDLKFEVTKAYYELVRWKMELQSQEDILQDIQEDLELAERLYTQELITQVEFLDIQSRADLLSYQITSIQGELSLAELTLRQALNLEPEEALPGVISQFDHEPELLMVSLEECIGVALENRPEIQLWEMTAASAEYDKNIAGKENRPKFSLNYSCGRSGEAYASETLDLLEEWSIMGKVTWLFGGSTIEGSTTRDEVMPEEISDTAVKTEATTHSLKFSLLDNLAYYSRKEEAAIVYRQSFGELTEKKKEIQREVEETWLSCQRAVAGAKANLARIEFQRKQIAVLKARFQVAEAPLSQLSGTKVDLSREVSSYISSLASYHLAKAALNKATGYMLEI